MSQILHITNIDPDFAPETHTLGATSAQSSAITTGSGLIRIAVKGTHAHVAFGSNPTADGENFLINADTSEIFSFISGQKVAFIKTSGTGEINISALD
jgi:hypothetical protein